MTVDLSATIVPKSDQLNAEDLLAGPMTVTVESVSRGNAEQPVDFHLIETPGRAYRPSKTMRRVIVAAWGKESDVYTGRRLTLYRDPDVKFGGQKVGGIKISHLSHIDKPFSLALTETRGKRAMHTVEPLKDESTRTPAPDVTTITDVDTLRGMWQAADATTRKQIEARVAELTAATVKPDDEPQGFDGMDDAGWAGEGA